MISTRLLSDQDTPAEASSVPTQVSLLCLQKLSPYELKPCHTFESKLLAT